MTYAARAIPVIGRAVAWLLVAGAVAAGAHYGYARYSAQKAASAPPQYFLQPASVGTVTLTADGTGTFQPASTENVAPKVGGTVTHVDVTVGQQVQAGDPLFELADTEGLAQQVALAQAALDQAQRQLQQLEDPAATEDPRVIQQDQLKVQQAQITLEQAQLNLEKDQAAAAAAAAVTSPVAGTVEGVDVTAGQQVGAGAALVVVQPSGAPTVTVSVPQQDLPYLPVGTAALVAIPALQQSVSGTVSAVSGTASGTVETTGRNGATASSSGGTQALFPLTVTLSGSVSGVPADAAVTVTFTPQGSPPPGYGWSDAGTIAYPAGVTLSAQQAGTVSGLPALGAAVAAGQQVATVTSAQGQANNAVTQDQNAIAQDQLALQQAQLTLSQAQDPASATPEAIAAQQAAVDSAQQDLQLKQQALSELTVRAPVAGIVQSVSVQPGDQANSGQNAVTLQSSGALQAVVDIDELSIDGVRPGQSAEMTVGAFPDQKFQGTVASIAPTAQTQFGVAVYPVYLTLQHPPANLRAGMTVTASILIKTASDALRVPSWSVTALTSGQGIVRVMQGGRPTPVRVQIGLQTPQWTQILSGLQPGEPVIAGDANAANSSARPLFFGGPGGFGGQVRAGAAVRGAARGG